MPEIQEAYFTMTFNRTAQNADFKWEGEDHKLIRRLRGIGLLTYAALFEDKPPQRKREEVNFGSVYLGQTLRINGGKYSFTGNWGGKEGEKGQFAIYSGFGRNFPHLAYYPSMALADPDIMDEAGPALEKIYTIESALELEPYERKKLLDSLNRTAAKNLRLKRAVQVGNQLVADLAK
jgi:hypothetical protein